jgi:hypothetical protein
MHTQRSIALVLLVAISLPAIAVEDGQVAYLGGTAPGVKEGAVGTLDTTSETALVFEYAGRKLALPYGRMQSWEYSNRPAHTLGVLPTIAIAMLKRPQRRHFFRISYRDEDNSPQVAIFEVSKQSPQSLVAILQTRAPQSCKPQPHLRCAPRS